MANPVPVLSPDRLLDANLAIASDMLHQQHFFGLKSDICHHPITRVIRIQHAAEVTEPICKGNTDGCLVNGSDKPPSAETLAQPRVSSTRQCKQRAHTCSSNPLSWSLERCIHVPLSLQRKNLGDGRNSNHCHPLARYEDANAPKYVH